MALPEIPQSFLRYDQDPHFRSDIDQLFQRVTIPVEEFIIRNGISIQKFHQGVPIWVLSWNRPDNLQRVIQIGAVLGEVDSPALTFIAYAYRDNPTIPPQREFSKRTLIGYIDEVVIDEDPNTPQKLLVGGWAVANGITAVGT